MTSLSQNPDRRSALRLAVAGTALPPLLGGHATAAPAVAAGGSSPGGPSIFGGAPAAADRKAWTRTHYRGIENLLHPSFGPDLETLDELGLRRDVRLAIAHGCFSTLFATLGHPVDVAVRALEVACSEAAGRILVGGFTEYPTLEQNVALVKGAAAAGCSHMLIMYPPGKTPDSKQEVHDYLRALIDASDIGIVLYALPHPGMKRFHPSGVPIDVLDALANLPTVAAMKFTQPIDPVLALACCKRFADRLAINCVPLELMPLLGQDFDLAWSGEWAVEGVQGPERRYVKDYVDAIAAKKLDAAAKHYWDFYPAYSLFSTIQVPKLKKGGHPWQHLKYYQWLTGGNGGLISVKGQTLEQIGKLTAADRKTMRDTLTGIGVTITDASDDEFITGVENAKRGLRPSDFVNRPYYE